jgi:hypothetical protein
MTPLMLKQVRLFGLTVCFAAHLTSTVSAAPMKWQLTEEIEQRFSPAFPLEDDRPLDFDFHFSRAIAHAAEGKSIRVSLLFAPVPESVKGGKRLDIDWDQNEEPTIVQELMKQSFPHAPLLRPADEVKKSDAYSYQLATEHFTFGGLTFSR